MDGRDPATGHFHLTYSTDNQDTCHGFNEITVLPNSDIKWNFPYLRSLTYGKTNFHAIRRTVLGLWPLCRTTSLMNVRILSSGDTQLWNYYIRKVRDEKNYETILFSVGSIRISKDCPMVDWNFLHGRQATDAMPAGSATPVKESFGKGSSVNPLVKAVKNPATESSVILSINRQGMWKT